MRRTILVVSVLILLVFPVVAGTQSGSTIGTLPDNSLVFKGYYQGPVENNPTTDSNITLEFKDNSGTVINHAAQQGASGTVVTADNSHVGQNGTIFTWSMAGTSTSTVHLNFSFSTLQAEVNGEYFVPAYSVVMTQGITQKVTHTVKTYQNNNSTVTWKDTTVPEDYGNDTFYCSSAKTKNITSITERPANPYSSEVLTVYLGNYSGAVSSEDGTAWGTKTSSKYETVNNRSRYVTTTTTISWERSGTCSLNISSFETERPGLYRYSCWVITELSIE